MYVSLFQTTFYRFDLFLLFLYLPVSIIESGFPVSLRKTTIVRISYGLFGLSILAFTVFIQYTLALDISTFDFIQALDRNFVEFVFYGGVGIQIGLEIWFIINFFRMISSKIEKNIGFFKLNASFWFIEALVSFFGAYVGYISISTPSPLNSSYQFLNGIIIFSLVWMIYLLMKLTIICITTISLGALITTAFSQICLITSTIIPFIFSEPVSIAGLSLNPFAIGLFIGLIGAFYLFIATITIDKNRKSITLYFWIVWAAIELILSVLGIFLQSFSLIIIGIPLTLIAMIITILISKGTWWAVDFSAPPRTKTPKTYGPNFPKLPPVKYTNDTESLVNETGFVGPPSSPNEGEAIDVRKKRLLNVLKEMKEKTSD